MPRNRNRVSKTCETCGKPFEVPYCRRNTAKCCSVKCMGKSQAKRYQSERKAITCPCCGKEFRVPKSSVGLRRYCSRECADSSYKCTVVGDKHPNWKGGLPRRVDGYIYQFIDDSDHPFSTQGHYVLQHRLVMEEEMRSRAPWHEFLIDIDGKKYLRPQIEVHHINQKRDDNRVENLVCCTSGGHKRMHNSNPPMVGEVWPEVEGMIPYIPVNVKCTCGVCGKPFLKKRSDVLRGSGKYCSRECYNDRGLLTT